jgi:hypothetical protein
VAYPCRNSQKRFGKCIPIDTLQATSPNTASLCTTIACSSPPTKISPRSSRSRARSTECRGEQKTVITELHFPPDTQACMFWPRIRRRRNWNLRAEVLLEGPDVAAQLETADEDARHPAKSPGRPSGQGPQANPRHRSLIKDSSSHKWRSRLSPCHAFIAHALLRWACTRRALLRHWPRSRMTMLYALQRRPEFCHPEFSSGLRRGFPTVAERMKIHLTTMRNVAD